MTSLRDLTRKFLRTLPEPLKQWLGQVYYCAPRGALLAELSMVPIVHTGYEEVEGNQTPFVVLEDGTILCGEWPTESERDFYTRHKDSIAPTVTEDTIAVAIDVITRYLYPHAMPQLTMPYSYRARQGFHLQHIETIEDFPHLSRARRTQLEQAFSLKPGESFLDIGAYLGYGTIRLSRELGAAARIVSVEAHPDMLALLEHNTRINNLSNVIIIPKAIWSEEVATLDLQKSRRQANSVIAGIVETTSVVSVQTTTVDAIRKDVGCFDLVSITVNGAEIEAIDGMKETLRQCEHIRLSIAGWYKRDGKRVCDIISPILRESGLEVAVGRKGRVLAWR